MKSQIKTVHDQDLVQLLRQRRAEARHKIRLLQQPMLQHGKLTAVAKVRYVLLAVVILAVASVVLLINFLAKTKGTL